MYDYLFFNDKLKSKFINKLEQLGAEYIESIDHDNLCVSVSEDLDEQIVDQIDDLYDILLDEQAEITITEEPESINLVGIQFSGKDNKTSQLRLSPEIMNRLHQVLSFSEIQQLVQDIADAALNPETQPLCKK